MRILKLGRTIRRVREAKGLTQRAAALELGITGVHLCEIEHDRSLPSFVLLHKMRRSWGMDIYALAWCLNENPWRLPTPRMRSGLMTLRCAWHAELGRQKGLHGETKC